MNDTCCICEEIKTKEFPKIYNEIYGIKNRICIETPDFIVIPSLSPLVSGHILIFPKSHINSLLQLPLIQVKRLDKLIERLTLYLGRQFGHPVYLFEHGTARDGIGACGITHAHLHLLPLSSSMTSELNSSAMQDYFPSQTGKLVDLLGIKEEQTTPYLLFGTYDKLFISYSAGLYSQYMRKKISRLLGNNEWDWKSLTGIQYFRETYNRFQLECC